MLRQAILDSELKPGQRLVERELIDQLQVSRATIRESLRELASEGLVTVIPQRGAVVASISESEALDLYDVRVAIERLLVDRFIDNATPEQLDNLRGAVASLRKATLAHRPIREMLTIKDEFYQRLLEGANSSVIANLVSGLHARVSVLRANSLSQPGRSLKALEELEGLVDAIGRRDRRAAARLCATHIKNAAKSWLANIEIAQG
jgi:DNA-binding GntR family transcriptional regulator